MGVDRARAAKRAEAPDLSQQLFLREDAVRRRGELGQQLELLRREEHALAENGDATCLTVELDLAGDEALARVGRGAAQHGADTGHELLVMEGCAR